MNKELALEQIDACILMLEQIKSSITDKGGGTMEFSILKKTHTYLTEMFFAVASVVG